MREHATAGDCPILSVITATYNRAEWIRGCIESVDASSVDVEHVIVDGGSTDGTLDMLRDYPRVDVISEPDKGIYDAWNKGIARSRGAYVVFVNSDDRLAPEAIDRALQLLDMLTWAPEVVSFGWEILSHAGRPVRASTSAQAAEISPTNLCLGTPAINARFFRRSLFARIGSFDATFRAAGDTEFLLRCWHRGASHAHFPVLLYQYQQHDDALTLNSEGRYEEQLDEGTAVAERYLAHVPAMSGVAETLRAWRAARVGGEVVTLLRRGQLRRAGRVAKAALRLDPVWLLRFPIFLLRLRMYDARGRRVPLVAGEWS